MNNLKNCKLIEVESPNQMILKAAINFMHCSIKSGSPKQIIYLLKTNLRQRACTDVRTIYGPRTKKFELVLENKGLKLYNSLSTRLRSLDVINFKKYIEKKNT